MEKFLKKFGVKKYEDLNAEEKETYREWEATLAGRQITQDEYRKFLEAELDQAINRLTDVDLSKESEIFRKVEVRMLRKIINFLDMPMIEKQLLEQNLN